MLGEYTKDHFRSPRHPFNEEEGLADGRAEKLFHGSKGRRIVVFAASGSGKTWLALRMLQRHGGLFFVCKDADTKEDKNAGSMDLSDMITLLSSSLDKGGFAGGDSAEVLDARREVAEFAAECLVFSRKLVLDAWLAKFPGKRVTPRAWLLLQLFPEHFCGADVFRDVSKQLVNEVWTAKARPLQDGHRDAVFNTMKSETPRRADETFVEVCVVDESQRLIAVLKDEFKALPSDEPQPAPPAAAAGPTSAAPAAPQPRPKSEAACERDVVGSRAASDRHGHGHGHADGHQDGRLAVQLHLR